MAADVVGGSIRKFVYDADGPAFLERWDWVWMGTGRSEFATVQVERCPFTHLEVPTLTSRPTPSGTC